MAWNCIPFCLSYYSLYIKSQYIWFKMSFPDWSIYNADWKNLFLAQIGTVCNKTEQRQNAYFYFYMNIALQTYVNRRMVSLTHVHQWKVNMKFLEYCIHWDIHLHFFIDILLEHSDRHRTFWQSWEILVGQGEDGH